jgi:formate/nitrite transporter FocA (FNT family)
MTPTDQEGSIISDRYIAEDIFERIILVADEEVSKGFRELFFSSLAAGFSITITVLLYASLSASMQTKIAQAMLYPLGFIFIILGNYQLFTENTLPPVVLILERMASIPALIYVWTVVLIGNLVGGFIGSLTLARTAVFSPEAQQAIIDIILGAFEYAPITLFFKALFAGVIVAGVVWLDFAARDTASRLILIYLAFLAIPLGGLYHVVTTATELGIAVLSGAAAITPSILYVLLPVLIGNTVGGVLFVTIVNYFQTPHYIQENPSRRLSFTDWLFTWNRGRSHDDLHDD